MNCSKKISFLLVLFSFSSVLLNEVNAQELKNETVLSETIVNADNGSANSSLCEKKEVLSNSKNETSKDVTNIKQVDFSSEVNKKDSNVNMDNNSVDSSFCDNKKEVLSNSKNETSKDATDVQQVNFNSEVNKKDSDVSNNKVDEIISPKFKYKNYDCREKCSHKDNGKSYNLVDRYNRFQHSVNKVIFNMCSDCAVKKVLSNPSVNNHIDFRSDACNMHYILSLLPNCCSRCYDRVCKAIVMAYCSCPHQYDAKYNIFETTFDNDDDNVSYEYFLYSLRSRLFQDYFFKKVDYDFIFNNAKEIDEEIERSKIFRLKKTHTEN